MNTISATDTVSEYTPERTERMRHDVEPPAELQRAVQEPTVKAAQAQRDWNTTIQQSVYTGKGSFIDGVF